MADFVAVIRRAVDGLADNTPEMRARVYEKARSAVTRQLESMKPRPPEEMLRRQLDKLDAAIAEVENEHAEALPSLEEEAAGQPHVAAVEDVPEHIPEPAQAPVAPPVAAAAEPSPAPVQQPVSEVAEAEAVDYETTGYDAQVAPYEDEPPREEPVAEGPSASWQPQPEPEPEYHPVEREPEPAPQYHPIPVPEPQLALPAVPEPMLLPVSEPAPALLPGPEAAAAAVQEAAVEPASEPWQPRHDEAAERAAAVHGSRVVEAMPGWDEEPKSAPQQAYGEPPVDHAAAVDAPGTGHHDDPTIPAWAREEQAAPAEVPSEPAHELRSEPVHEVHEAAVPASAKPAFDEDVAVTAFDDFVRDDLTPMPRESWPEPKMPAATEDLSWDPAPFDDNSLGQAPTAKKTQDQDLEFDDFLEPLPAAGSAGAAGAGKKAGGKAAGNGRPSVSAKDIFDMETIEARRPAKAIRTVASRVASDPAAAAQVDALMRGVRAIAEARPAMGKPTPQDVDAEALAVRALASGDAVLALSTADIQQLAGAVLTERLTPSSADLINAALEMVEASRVDLSRAFSGARRDVALRRRDAAEGLRAAATAWRRAHWAGNVQTNKQVKHG